MQSERLTLDVINGRADPCRAPSSMIQVLVIMLVKMRVTPRSCVIDRGDDAN